MSLSHETLQALQAIEGGASVHTLESQALDFKTVGRSRDDTLADLAEAASCFANALGGQVVVGVRDAVGGPDAFVDVNLDAARVQRRIFELTDPGLVVTAETDYWREHRLLTITVPRSPTVHQVKGRAVERVGADCQPMRADRIAAVLAERRGHDWSADDSGTPADRVAPRAVDEARQLLRESPDLERQRWAEASVPDLLRRLGVMAPAGSLTNGGVLLFVNDDERHIAQYVHRRTRSGELTTNQRLTGPGLSNVLTCMELIDNRMDRTPINLPTGQQLLVADLPEPAFREAIVNAFVHRDHTVAGGIQIEHSPTQLTVTSPGDFVLGVTPENILTVSSRPRNPALAVTIRHLGLAETAGVGVDRMYAEMTRLGHHPPAFESDHYRVTVTLNGGAPNKAVTRFVATLPIEHWSDPDTLLVLFRLLTKRTVTADQLEGSLQKPLPEVELVLRQLAAPPVNLIERTRESTRLRRGVYRLRGHALAQLGSAVTYWRRAGDEIDRKVIEIVRETTRINGRTVRTILDVDMPTASRILSDLVERQVLVKTSTAQRGSAVTYGPGPQFPHPPRSHRSRRI